MKTNWNVAVAPLLKEYAKRKHPLEYNSIYELIVMVVLSAQSTDKIVNTIAPQLFQAFPNMEALSRCDVETLIPYITKVRNFRNKANWLIKIAGQVKQDKNIPKAMDELVKLPGIGRKSANVIMREAKAKAVGVIVDLHVLRVAPRLGIASQANSEDATKMEKELMSAVDQKHWGELGMAISFLGREICRPSDPLHSKCVMNKVCNYYTKSKTKSKPKAKKK
ncbi:MAG: endonuclease III [Bacteroidetes bacterium]|nr:endonuclease III [Bacteroidota bacterium]